MINSIVIKPNTGKTELVFLDDEDTLKALQESVGGLIERVYVNDDMERLKIDLYVNEEGKLLDLEENALIIRDGSTFDVLVGPMIFVSCNEEGETVGLSAEQIEYIIKYIKFGKGRSYKNNQEMRTLAILSV